MVGKDKTMTQFLDPASYMHLCPKCRSQLTILTQQFAEDMFGDTDDEEAPSMFMYDHRLYCSADGDHCANRFSPAIA